MSINESNVGEIDIRIYSESETVKQTNGKDIKKLTFFVIINGTTHRLSATCTSELIEDLNVDKGIDALGELHHILLQEVLTETLQIVQNKHLSRPLHKIAANSFSIKDHD